MINCNHDDPSHPPIYWNPYNKVFNCHKCGQTFISTSELVTRLKLKEKLINKLDRLLNNSKWALEEAINTLQLSQWLSQEFKELIEEINSQTYDACSQPYGILCRQLADSGEEPCIYCKTNVFK